MQRPLDTIPGPGSQAGTRSTKKVLIRQITGVALSTDRLNLCVSK